MNSSRAWTIVWSYDIRSRQTCGLPFTIILNAGAGSTPYAAHVHIAKNAASTGKAKAAITTFAFTIFFPINVHSLGLYGSYL